MAWSRRPSASSKKAAAIPSEARRPATRATRLAREPVLAKLAAPSLHGMALSAACAARMIPPDQLSSKVTARSAGLVDLVLGEAQFSIAALAMRFARLVGDPGFLIVVQLEDDVPEGRGGRIGAVDAEGRKGEEPLLVVEALGIGRDAAVDRVGARGLVGDQHAERELAEVGEELGLVLVAGHLLMAEIEGEDRRLDLARVRRLGSGLGLEGAQLAVGRSRLR